MPGQRWEDSVNERHLSEEGAAEEWQKIVDLVAEMIGDHISFVSIYDVLEAEGYELDYRDLKQAIEDGYADD